VASTAQYIQQDFEKAIAVQQKGGSSDIVMPFVSSIMAFSVSTVVVTALTV